MRAAILDPDALRAISPIALAGFARAEGWAKVETYGAHADVYAAAQKPEIILPRTAQLGDYASVVAKLIGIFAEVAGRDDLAIYRDLSSADRDVLRVSATAGNDDGSVAIDTGVEIVRQSREMLLAAACATSTPQTLYRAGANKQAMDYLSRVRLGQTEHGSFVVTLLAPIPPKLDLPQTALWPDMMDEPFERQVTRRLAGSLNALRNALELATSGDDLAFEKAVEEGVSANLCEAIGGLVAQSPGINIGLTWARTRPTPEPYRQVAFSSNDADILMEAARIFRSLHPRPDQTLVGRVVKLKRDYDEVQGAVTLRAFVDDKSQSVQVVLDQASYRVAADANQTKSPVLVRGDLERVGQRWQLINARIAAVADEETETTIHR